MRIKKIKLENIRSYENQEIEFPEGSILLSGDIGCGKTSVLLAIEFALFGLQPSQRGSSLLRNGTNEGKVILEFEVDGKNIILERSLKKAKSISQDYASISIDNEKFEESVTEIKNKVLKLLNYPSEFSKKTNLLYRFTVYTPQEEMKQIILESSETRLNTLRHVFGIDKYKRIEENLDILNSKLKETIKIKEGQTSDLGLIKEALQKKKDSILEMNKNKEERQRLLQEQKTRTEIIEKQVKEVEGKVNEKKNFEIEKGKSFYAFQSKKEASIDLKNQIQRLAEEIEEGKKLEFNESLFNQILEDIKRNIEREKVLQEEFISISGQINSLLEKKQEAEKLKEKISRLDQCPTCLQEVNEEYKNNIFKNADKEIEEINKYREEKEKRKIELSEDLKKTRQSLEDLNSKKSEQEIKKIKLERVNEKQKTLLDLEKKRQQTEQDINMISQQITILEKNIESLSNFSILYDEKKKELDLVWEEEKEYSIRLAEINKEIEITLRSIEETELKIKEKEGLIEKINYFKELKDWISEKFLNLILLIEKNVMLKLREEFSKLFTEWFSVLVPESLNVRLDEHFSPIIEQQGYELSYSYLSGGERTSVALAYRLSLNQTINFLLSRIKTSDLIILDEPTDGFSETQLDKMRDVLQELNAKQLVLVSHESKIEGFVDNILRFKKEAGVTIVEKGNIS